MALGGGRKWRVVDVVERRANGFMPKGWTIRLKIHCHIQEVGCVCPCFASGPPEHEVSSVELDAREGATFQMGTGGNGFYVKKSCRNLIMDGLLKGDTVADVCWRRNDD